MFHMANTEAQRQKLFDDYLLSILKEKEVIKKNRKIIDEGNFSYDPTIDENKVKGAFNSYVDSLVIKNYLIEQIYSRLKISKSMAMSFVNKLDANQLLILSKVVNEFIKDIQEKYQSINDYILKTSFDELQTNYNVIQQQEKNDEIVNQNQVEQGQTLQENIPAEEKDPAEDDELTEEEKLITFLKEVIFGLKGTSAFGKNIIKKTLLGVYVYNNPNVFENSLKKTTELNILFEKDILMMLSRRADKREARLEIQSDLINIYQQPMFIPPEVEKKPDNRKLISEAQRAMMGGMKGSGYGMNYPVLKDEYIPIGKYKAHKEKLMGGKLQMRSHNNHQIHNLKTQNITKNIRDILLKLNKNEPIKFSDVDNLTTEEKDQLYMIGKNLHITQLFDIPSTLKSQEDKLKDEFLLLRGSLLAGNNNPDLLRKFKIVLLKMKNKKLISLQEYNEVLNILLEIEI